MEALRDCPLEGQLSRIAALLENRTSLCRENASLLWELSKHQRANGELSQALDQALQVSGGIQGTYNKRVRAYEMQIMRLEDMDSQRLEIKCLKAMIREQQARNGLDGSRMSSEVGSSSLGASDVSSGEAGHRSRASNRSSGRRGVR
jgi:hypothetical protein